MKNLIVLNTERRLFPSYNPFLSKLYLFFENNFIKMSYKFFTIPKLKKYLKKDNTKIISVDQETDTILNERSIPFISINEYITSSDSINSEKKAWELIQTLSDSTSDININYNHLSFLDTDASDVYWSFFHHLIPHIENIHKIINIEKPNRLIILNSWSKHGIIQKDFNSIVPVIDDTNKILKISKKITTFLTPIVTRIIRRNLFKKTKKQATLLKKSQEIIFFDRERAFKYSLPFLEKIKNKITILQDNEYQQNNYEFNFDLLSNYLDDQSKIELIQFNKMLFKKLKFLKTSKEFKKTFKYKNVFLFEPLSDLLDYLFILSYPNSAFYYLCMNNFFQKNKIKLVILMGEEPKGHRVMLHLAQKHKSKILFVSHGAFGFCHEYNNLKSDKITVYGHHYKNILVKLNKNNPQKIVVTGNPYWDNIVINKFEKDKIISNLNLDKNIKKILFATTHIPLDLRDAIANATIKAMSNLPNCQLIIKLHPEEKPDVYQNLLEKSKLNAYITDDITQLHSLIFISDVVIVSHSTVGLETLLLNKPLIDLSLTKMPFYQDYVEKGVALGVRNEEDLLPAIKSLLENETVRKKLEKNRKKYIYEHAYKQDGKAADRVVKLINKMLKETEAENKISKEKTEFIQS